LIFGFIALSTFGHLLDPDIVVASGRADAVLFVRSRMAGCEKSGQSWGSFVCRFDLLGPK